MKVPNIRILWSPVGLALGIRSDNPIMVLLPWAPADWFSVEVRVLCNFRFNEKVQIGETNSGIGTRVGIISSSPELRSRRNVLFSDF